MRIKHLLLILIISFTLVSCSMQKQMHVIFFGDSITEAGVKPGGYIIRLNDILVKNNVNDKYRLTGTGLGGNKVYDLYLRMDDDVLKKKPDVVLIYVGVNDVWHKQSFGTGTDADKFEKFYNAILSKLSERKIKVVVCTPAVIGEKADGTNGLDADLNKYSDIIRKIAQQRFLPIVDLRKIFMDYEKLNNRENNESGVLTNDRVHLNDTGNQLAADEMWKVLNTMNK